LLLTQQNNCLYIIHADRDASNASPVEPKE